MFKKVYVKYVVNALGEEMMVGEQLHVPVLDSSTLIHALILVTLRIQWPQRLSER